MMPFCEVMAKKYAPAIRSLVANKLYREFNRSEVEIAKMMGLTQPAVSHYIHLRRGSKMITKLLSEPEVKNAIYLLAKAINEGMEEDVIIDRYCEICKVIRKKLHKEETT
jgi:hypothetical protein